MTNFKVRMEGVLKCSRTNDQAQPPAGWIAVVSGCLRIAIPQAGESRQIQVNRGLVHGVATDGTDFTDEGE
jgi:hypothetical protein